MNTLWSALFISIVPWLALFLKLSSGQGIQVAPVSLANGDLFTATVLGSTIPFPVTFNYNGNHIIAQSSTTTAIYTFTSVELGVGVFNIASTFGCYLKIVPTVSGPNSANAYIGPVSLGQQSVTATFGGNFPHPITYTIYDSALLTNGTLQPGVSTVVFNAPTAFSALDVYAEYSGTTFAELRAIPLIQLTASPSIVRIGYPVIATVSPTANATASLTYQLYDSTGALTSETTLPSSSTTWQFDAPSDTGVYELAITNGIGASVYGKAYTSLTVVSTPVIVQPTPGTLLLAGSSVTASIVGYDTASAYTLSFVNGAFAYITTVPGSVSMPVLPVPSNYIGQLYLTAAQYGESDVATYTISVAQAVHKARNLRRRAHIGG